MAELAHGAAAEPVDKAAAEAVADASASMDNASAVEAAAEGQAPDAPPAAGASSGGPGAKNGADASDVFPDERALREALDTQVGDVYMVQWLSRVESVLESAPPTALDSERARLLDVLLAAVCGEPPSGGAGAPPSEGPAQGAASVWPAILPSRPVRQSVARCVNRLYAQEPGLHPTQRDVVARLLSLAEATQRDPSPARHVAALSVSHALFAAHSDALLPQQGEAVALALRLARASSGAVLSRFHALQLLESALGSGVPPSVAPKDLYKALRNALGDKAGPVVRGAAACLETLLRTHDALRTPGEAVALVTLCVKSASAGADCRTRGALASLVAALLTQTTLAAGGPPAGPSQEEDEEETAGKAPIPQPMFPPPALLDTLAHHWERAGSSGGWPARSALLQMYAAVFARLGTVWLEQNYESVLHHILHTFARTAAGAGAAEGAAEGLRVQHGARLLLRSIARALPEAAQEQVATVIATSVLGAWPPRTPGTPPPHELELALALQELASLVAQLGGVPPTLHDALYEPLLHVLAHPARCVQVHAAWCLRVVCEVQPRVLGAASEQLLAYLERDAGALDAAQHDGGASLRARLAGHTDALAALVPVGAANPLYASYAHAERMFALGTRLLQHSGERALADAAPAIRAAWTLVASLFAHGAPLAWNHLPTLLSMWRGALARPSVAPGAGELPWAFLIEVRECALGSLLSFLVHGGRELLTPEASRRVMALLGNVLALLDACPRGEGAPPLHMLRARVMRCFALMVPRSGTAGAPGGAPSPLAPVQRSLVTLALHTFAQPTRYEGSAAQAAISASSGAYATLWGVRDNYAFGVTSLERGSARLADEGECALPSALRARAQTPEDLGGALDALAQEPVLGTLVHDPATLFLLPAETHDAFAGAERGAAPVPVGAATAEVDAALELFAALLPSQERETQVSAAEYLLAASRSSSLERNPGRRMAVLVNGAVGLLGALRTAMHRGGAARSAAGFANERVNTAVRQLAHAALLQGDAQLRGAAGEMYGRLAAVAGSHALSAQMHFLLEQIVGNRNADARASCALAAGQLYRLVGGLNASPLTRTVSSLLLSLARDAHPSVHYHALEALHMVVDAAGLGYQPYVSSTLGLLVQLYAMATHEPEGGSAGSANLRVSLPVYASIGRVLGALLGVLGADLRERGATRRLVHALLRQLALDHAAGAACVAEAVRALERLALVVPETLEHPDWARTLRALLHSDERTLQHVAVSAYAQMAQRGAAWLTRHGGVGLLRALLLLHDRDPSQAGVRTLVLAWIQHSARAAPLVWVDVCRAAVLAPEAFGSAGAGSGAAPGPTTSAPDAAPEEEALRLDSLPAEPLSGALSSWRTQLFLLQCLHHVFLTARHAQLAAAGGARVADLIKMAFSASTALHTVVRLQGLAVLREVVETYAQVPDPDFPESRLLEQFHAPITAALMPAFAADSAPEVLGAALDVCAVYVRTSAAPAATERVTRQLTHALSQCAEPQMRTLGELGPLTPSAVAFLKLGVWSAWAELQVATPHQTFLQDVVRPHLSALAQVWVAALVQYAVLREDPHGEAGATSGASDARALLPAIHADGVLGGLARDQLLGYFAPVWARLLQAVAVTGTHQETVLRDALGEAGAASTSASPMLALYALALEQVCAELGQHSTPDRAALHTALASLRVLVDARYVGEALLHDALYSELLQLVRRALFLDDTPLQLGVLGVVRALTQAYRERLLEDDDGVVHDEALARTKLGALLRATHAFVGRLPGEHRPVAEKAALLAAALQAQLEMALVGSLAVQEDVLALMLHTFIEYARREDDAAAMLPTALPVLAAVARHAGPVAAGTGTGALQRALHGFLSALLDVADAMRARAGGVADVKRRNALLGACTVIAGLDNRVSVSSAVVEHLAFLLSDQLRHGDARIALQGLRMLEQAAQAAPRHSVHACLGMTIPALVAYAAAQAGALERGTDGGRDAAGAEPPALTEAFAVLYGLVGAVPEADRANALCIALPTFVLLVRSAPQGSAAVRAVAAQLVQVAQQHAAAFKVATARLPEEERAIAYDALRRAFSLDEPARSSRPDRGSGASISLRTFGS